MEANIRASDADRTHVLDLLGEAYAQGCLDLAEFEERQEKALRMRYLNECRPLLADLPPHLTSQIRRSPQPGAMPAPRLAAEAVPVPATTSYNPTVILGNQEVVPSAARQIIVNSTCVMGDLKVELGEALGPGRVVELHMVIIMGNCTVYLPPGVNVVDNVSKVMGDVRMQKYRANDGSNGTLNMRGVIVMGDVKVLPSRYTSEPPNNQRFS